MKKRRMLGVMAAVFALGLGVAVFRNWMGPGSGTARGIAGEPGERRGRSEAGVGEALGGEDFAEGASVPRIGRKRRGGVGASSAEGTPGSRVPWVDSLISGTPETLSAEDFQRWMESGRTNASDLLAIRQAGGGVEYLREALAKFPNDPRVLAASIALDDDPEIVRARMAKFREVAPDNALADYLSAANEFRSGNTEQALAHLDSASGKAKFEDYVAEAMETAEALLLASGKSPTEAKAMGSATTLLPHLAKMKEVANGIQSVQESFMAKGDTLDAGRIARYGVEMSRHLADGGGSLTLIGELVGVAAEKIVLKNLPQGESFDFLQGTPADRVASLEQRRQELRAANEGFDVWIRGATEDQIAGYFDQLRLHGEAKALQWMRELPRPAP